MANNADGTDGRGAPSLGKTVTSGKSSSDYGKGSNRGIPSGGKAVSGKVDSSYGTAKARNTGGNVNGGDGNGDRSAISQNGGKF